MRRGRMLVSCSSSKQTSYWNTIEEKVRWIWKKKERKKTVLQEKGYPLENFVFCLWKKVTGFLENCAEKENWRKRKIQRRKRKVLKIVKNLWKKCLRKQTITSRDYTDFVQEGKSRYFMCVSIRYSSVQYRRRHLNKLVSKQDFPHDLVFN